MARIVRVVMPGIPHHATQRGPVPDLGGEDFITSIERKTVRVLRKQKPEPKDNNQRNQDRLKNLSVSGTAFLLAILVAGCGTLPDGKPFADATGTWSASVKTSGQALSDSLRDAGSVEPKDKDSYEKNVKAFEEAWSVRVKAAQGVVAYSSAIADLIAASKEGGETVKKAGDALSGLAAAVNIPLAAPA